MRPEISYVICSMPRSGSHFLGTMLQETGRAGKPDEYFICDHEGQMENERGNIAEIYGTRDLSSFRDLVIELGSSANGTFGVTIMWSYFHTFLDNYRTLPRYRDLPDYELVDALLYHPKYVWLTRRDKVRQAISLSKATQTNVWIKPHGAEVKVEREPEFKFYSIENYRKRLVAADQSWQDYFQANNISPFKVVYEDFALAPEETLRGLLQFLEIPTAGLEFPQAETKKQSNAFTAEWVARYHLMRLYLKLRGKIAALRHYDVDRRRSQEP